MKTFDKRISFGTLYRWPLLFWFKAIKHSNGETTAHLVYHAQVSHTQNEFLPKSFCSTKFPNANGKSCIAMHWANVAGGKSDSFWSKYLRVCLRLLYVTAPKYRQFPTSHRITFSTQRSVDCYAIDDDTCLSNSKPVHNTDANRHIEQFKWISGHTVSRSTATFVAIESRNQLHRRSVRNHRFGLWFWWKVSECQKYRWNFNRSEWLATQQKIKATANTAKIQGAASKTKTKSPAAKFKQSDCIGEWQHIQKMSVLRSKFQQRTICEAAHEHNTCKHFQKNRFPEKSIQMQNLRRKIPKGTAYAGRCSRTFENSLQQLNTLQHRKYV